MLNFAQSLRQQLHIFAPFYDLEIQIEDTLFSTSKGNVSQYLQEMIQVGQQLCRQTQPEYAEIYAQKLVQQFDLLQKTIQQHQKTSTLQPFFRSSYQFPKNIHHLPKEKRLVEYRKALRLLNEKLSWLTTQAQTAQVEQRTNYISQITETEYRKMKCLKMIDELENHAMKVG